MAGVMLETPSRVWRRIEAGEENDMPSLPSMPVFDDSAAGLSSSQRRSDSIHPSDESDQLEVEESLPFHSTPTAFLHQTASTIRPLPGSSGSTARFANSVAMSRSSKSTSTNSQSRFGGSGSASRPFLHESFEVSEIRPFNNDSGSSDDDGVYPPAISMELANSRASNHYISPGPSFSDEDLDLTEALEDISRSNSPFRENELEHAPTPPRNGKYNDYSASLRSEPKLSPLPTKSSRYANVSFRKPLERARTPSLTRTSPSLASSVSSNSTPASTRSMAPEPTRGSSPLPGRYVPLPRSRTGSPSTTPRPSTSPPISHHDEEHTVSDDLRSSDGLPGSDITDSVHRHDASTMPEVRESDLESADEDQNPGHSQEETPSSSGGRYSSDATPHANGARAMKSPTPMSTTFSSPVPTPMFTPTPAFAPRPRARFQPQNNQLVLPARTTPPSNDVSPEQYQQTQASSEHEDDYDEELDPVTPHAHKRSFLMDVINSTARPRLKFPTPHPNRLAAPAIEDSPNSSTDRSPEQNSPPAPAQAQSSSPASFSTAFGGITPRPRSAGSIRPRFSHPLSQGWTAEPESDPDSPFDPLNERASFVSTASSHDLTNMHVRANASFDAAVGLGAQGTGVGRFNASKLNTYLHGLNRRLEEENEALVERLRKIEEDRKIGFSAAGAVSVTRPRFSSAGKRVSMSPGMGLGDVVEENEAAEWMEEKEELENAVEGLKSELEKFKEDKEQAHTRLEAERAERSRDKERWRERMGEVERGVEGIVRDLEGKLEEAESRAKSAEDTAHRLQDVEHEISRMETERDSAMQRAESAERALASGEDLGAELNAANQQISDLTSDLKGADEQIQELEQQVAEATDKVQQLEKELKEEGEMVDGLDQELQARLEDLDRSRKQIEALKKDARSYEDELQATKAYVSELEQDAGSAADRIESLQEELGAAQDKLHGSLAEADELRERMEHLEDEVDRDKEMARQLEEALEAAEKKMADDEEEVAELKGNLTVLKREKEREHAKSISRVAEPSSINIAADIDVEALEEELDDAHREIARLNALMGQSPARKAVDRAKDTRIEMLEKERDDLLERMRSQKAVPTQTPSKFGTNSGVSPFHRQILSLMSPKTPGGPMKDMSWLNATMHDPTVAPLVSEIARLQRELDRANESIDEKLEQLEDAGFGNVGLTQQLEDARARVSALEDEIARLSRKDDRRTRRMQKMKCNKCRTKVDFQHIDAEESFVDVTSLSLASEPPTPPSKASETLRANLQSVNRQLAGMKKQWEDERRQLLGEKAVLQNAAHKLNQQVRDAQAEVKRIAQTEKAGQRARASVEGELESARDAVAGLESELKEERSRLRALTTEQGRFERQKHDVLIQLQRTESDMEDVKLSLQRAKQENQHLETELRTNATAEQKARHLSQKVKDNSGAIDQLRQERSLLARDHKDLQTRYSEVTNHMNTLREQYKASQSLHDNRRHELDMHLLEIEDLRRALSDRQSELERVEAEKSRVGLEKSDFLKTVKALEADLQRVRKDAERFGSDLKVLRGEKDKLEERRRVERERAENAERAEKQLKARMRILTEELDGEKERYTRVQAEWRAHVCTADDDMELAMKTQHKQECKGLIVQIKYLKAKFTRESCLRCDLGYQKQYLLVLLSRFERTEHKILASIAKIGFAVHAPSDPTSNLARVKPKKRTFKSVANSVLFICRAKRAGELWRDQFANRQAVMDALQDVRRRRAAAS